MAAGTAIPGGARGGLATQAAAAKPGVTTSATPSAITAHPARLTGIAAMVGADSAWSASAPLTAVAAPTAHTLLPAGAVVGVARLTARPAHTPGPTGRALTVVGAEDAGGPLAAGAALATRAPGADDARGRGAAQAAAPKTSHATLAAVTTLAAVPGDLGRVGAGQAGATLAGDTAGTAVTALAPAAGLTQRAAGPAGTAGTAHTAGTACSTGAACPCRHAARAGRADATVATDPPGPAKPAAASITDPLPAPTTSPADPASATITAEHPDVGTVVVARHTAAASTAGTAVAQEQRLPAGTTGPTDTTRNDGVPAGAAHPAVTHQRAAVAAGAAGPPGKTAPTDAAIADQPGSPATTAGDRARTAGRGVAGPAVAEPQPAGTAIRVGRGSRRAVADQIPPQQHIGRRIEKRVEQPTEWAIDPRFAEGVNRTVDKSLEPRGW